MYWYKLIPVSVAIVFLILTEYSFRYINFVWWWFLVALLFIFLVGRLVLKKRKQKWPRIISLIIFSFSVLLLTLFLDRDIFRQFLLITATFVVFWNFSEFVALKESADEIKPWNLKTREVTNLFTLFFLNAVFSGWLIFVAAQFWLVLIIEAVVLWFFIFSFLGDRGVERRKIVIPALVFSLIGGELFWAINLLPLGFLMLSVLQTSIMIYLANLFFWHLQKIWPRGKILAYSIIVFLIIILSLISARWI